MPTLKEALSARTTEGALYRRLDRSWVHCYACGHNCRIPDGAVGVCKVRFNAHGRLMVPWGYAAGVQCDPIEKKPFFHVHPGALAYSFGMLGCDLHCGYCQNWVTSQALRDPQAVALPLDVTPPQLAQDAVARGAKIVVSTYNEPLITAEWAVAVFKEARAAGLMTGFVSNGNGTPEVLDFIQPFVSLYKVDLKSFRDKRYREMGGTLDAVTRTIRSLHERRIWLEVVTLVIPGFNDSDGELGELAAFLASVSPDIPWHVTAFHQDYKMTEPPRTTADALVRACEIGVSAGLRYVYAGNLPGRAGTWENTYCPGCRALLVERVGFRVLADRVSATGGCPDCGRAIPGFWQASV
jgi:pyruvate formate lyase activating enzyme